MQPTSKDIEHILSEVGRAPGGRVKVAMADVDGVLRGKAVHKDKFLAAAKGGMGFCSVVFGWDCADACYDNAQYTGWHTGYPDAEARIDLRTHRTVPWEGDVPLFLADFVDGAGEPLAVCPRQVLRRVVARAATLGLRAVVGCELEWFNFRETPETARAKSFVDLTPLSPGMFGYSMLRAGQHDAFLSALFENLAAFGVPLEGLHTETGPGVLEAALVCTDALEAADRAVLFKWAAKTIAARHGVMASFMAKPSAKLAGCGGHVHQSLVDSNGANVLYDGRRPHRMSALFSHYVAGQLHCLPHVLPLLLPNINSYKRLREGVWAPTRMSWGSDNRTVALRVIGGGAKATRLETRLGGADINPYLAIAAMVAAGLYGIERKLPLGEAAVKGSAYAGEAPSLPPTLAAATEVFAHSAVARELFGDAFVDHYAASRAWECRQYQEAVTSWELERYFEII